MCLLLSLGQHLYLNGYGLYRTAIVYGFVRTDGQTVLKKANAKASVLVAIAPQLWTLSFCRVTVKALGIPSNGGDGSGCYRLHKVGMGNAGTRLQIFHCR